MLSSVIQDLLLLKKDFPTYRMEWHCLLYSRSKNYLETITKMFKIMTFSSFLKFYGFTFPPFIFIEASFVHKRFFAHL